MRCRFTVVQVRRALFLKQPSDQQIQQVQDSENSGGREKTDSAVDDVGQLHAAGAGHFLSDLNGEGDKHHRHKREQPRHEARSVFPG